jgi:hypothetical protein
VKGLAKLQALRDMAALRDYVDEGPVGKRRLPVLSADDDEDEGEARADADGDGDEDDVDESIDAEASAEFDVEEFASEALDAE